MADIFSFDLVGIIQTFGYVGMFAIIFAESGLFFGFFLPGDSLLFTAGLLASQGFLNIVPLTILVVIAAISGDSVGYWFGKMVGPSIFNKEDSLIFNKRHLHRTAEFYERYGSKAIVLSRFVPIVRTFTPILAGVGKMDYKRFLHFNITGGFLWAAGVTILGFTLGATVPNIEKYLLPIILGIIFVSFLPIVYEFVKTEKQAPSSDL